MYLYWCAGVGEEEVGVVVVVRGEVGDEEEEGEEGTEGEVDPYGLASLPAWEATIPTRELMTTPLKGERAVKQEWSSWETSLWDYGDDETLLQGKTRSGQCADQIPVVNCIQVSELEHPQLSTLLGPRESVLLKRCPDYNKHNVLIKQGVLISGCPHLKVPL